MIFQFCIELSIKVNTWFKEKIMKSNRSNQTEKNVFNFSTFDKKIGYDDYILSLILYNIYHHCDKSYSDRKILYRNIHSQTE